MKSIIYSICCVTLLLITNSIVAQKSRDLEYTSLSELLQNAIAIQDSPLDDYEIFKTQQIAEMERVYNLDYFNYFTSHKYDTDLHKKVYKKTDEYASNLESLKEERKQLLRNVYSLKWDVSISDYDIKNRRFQLSLGPNYNMAPAGANAPKTIKDITFVSLPTTWIAYENGQFGSNIKEEVIFIPMKEDLAVRIEGLSISIYLLFKLDGKYTSRFRFNGGGEWYNMTKTHLCTHNVLLIIANEQTDEILFQKWYKN